MKILIHFSHYETLGHTSRILNLCKYLKSYYGDNIDLTVLQGGRKQDFIDFSFVNLVHIPEPIVGREWIKSKKKKIIDSEKIRIRVRFIIDFLKKSKPDIFIVEYFPFGRALDKYEILPVLRFIKEKIPKIKVISSVGYPILNFQKKDLLTYAKFFDKILIHCPESMDKHFIEKTYSKLGVTEVPVQDYKEVFELLKEKIVFTDYIVPFGIKIGEKDKAREEMGLPDKKIIMVSRGGGVIYPKIISSALLSKKYLGNDYFIVAVEGPATTKQEHDFFSKIAARFKQIELIKYSNRFLEYLNACDVSVSMCGYNTIVQTLFFSKPAVLFPKLNHIGKGEIEQIYRINLFNEYLENKVLNYYKFNTEELAKSIVELCNKNPVKKEVNKDFFKGGKFTAKIIEKVVNS